MNSSTTPSAPTTTARRTRSRRSGARRRLLPATVAAALLSVSVLAGQPAAAASSSTTVLLSDWNQSNRTVAPVVDSEPATDSESRGVVLIDTVLGYESAAAAGTGIVLTSDGEVLTNYHVVEGATSIKVTIATTGKTYTATVVGHDQTDDVAVLQLEDASGLSAAQLDDDTVTAGDEVSAVGNAGGTGSLTAADGTVVALDQTITTESEGSTAGETLQDLIMTDADVVAGDSGGPLVDAEGEVIGVTTAASSGGEIDGYAIPIEEALSIVKQIVSGQESGDIEIGADAFLGVELSSPAMADQASGYPAYGYPGLDAGWDSQATGAEIAGVVADGPAAQAGLTAGDTLTGIGGTAVTSADDLSSLIQTYAPGDRVAISWTDLDGSSQSATVTLATNPVA